MEIAVTDNQVARDALRMIVDEAGISLTALSGQQKIAVGSLTRFVNNRARRNGERIVQSNDIYLATFIRALDGVGYEVIVRPKESGSRRERRLRELKERANGRQGVRPDRG